MSEVTPLLHGVVKGSVPSPNLFLLDFSKLGKITCSFKNVSHYLFADDIQYCPFNDLELHKLADLHSSVLWAPHTSRILETMVLGLTNQTMSLDSHWRILVINCFYILKINWESSWPNLTQRKIFMRLFPLLDYYNHLWTSALKSAVSRPQLAQNAVARILTGINNRVTHYTFYLLCTGYL